jgi:hypothetical protein
MAIQFHPNELGAFSNVNFGNDDAIANLGEGKGEFDLSDPDTATLTGVHFGQTVEAPEPRKANRENWAAL